MFSKIKSNLSKIITVLIIILVIIGIIALIGRCRKSPSQNYYLSTIDSLGQVVKKYKDDSGRIHLELQQKTLSYEEAKLFFQKELDSTSKVLKIKDKQILSLTKIISETNGSGSGLVKDSIVYVTKIVPGKSDTFYLDSLKIIDINDGYLTAKIKVNKGEFDYSYNYIDSLNIVEFYKKSGFLGLNRTHYLDVSSNNLSTDITNLKNYKIQDKYKEKITLSVGVTYGYNGNRFIVMPGIQLGYRLLGIKFKKK